MKTVIIGGVAGGASCAARLRRLDENAEIVIFEKGQYVSFANCGLPYYVGGVITDKSKLTLQSPEGFKSKFNIDVKVNNEVVGIDVDAKQVTVKDVNTGEQFKESYDKLVITTGADAIKPPKMVAGVEKSERLFTLRNIPDTYRVKDFVDNNKPKNAVVVGGGFIGVETAENLQDIGVNVTLVEFAPQILAPIDQEMAADVQNHVRMHGVELRLGVGVDTMEEVADGMIVKLTDGSEIKTEMVMLAIGVAPESKIVVDAGIECNERKYVKVDEFMRTSAEDVYACGDVIEVTEFVSGNKLPMPLAGPANKQGRIVADHICGLEKPFNGTQGTSVLKVFDMTVAATGLNERNAKRMGIECATVYAYPGSHAGYYPGAMQMGLKLVYNPKDGTILGCQGVGYDGVEKRIDVVATAIRFGGKVSDLVQLELSYAPPFSSAKDPVNMLGFIAENIMEGRINPVYFNQIDDLVKEKGDDAYFIDVRSEMEFANGSIPGFVNIPVEKVREEIEKLDKSKPVYVTCQVGARGNNMSRVFMQNGFETYNLLGGYRLYSSVKKDQEGGRP